MNYFTLLYHETKVNIVVEEAEVQARRLKNHIIRHFDKIHYDRLNLFVVQENGSVYSLDDNELVDTDMKLLLEIDDDLI